MKDGGKAPGQRAGGDAAWARHAEHGGVGESAPQRRRVRELRDAQRERARLEDALEQAQRFDGLGRLARGVAHDIGNLIAVIANSTASARQRLGADATGAARDLDQIDRAARMVGDISRQLLAFGQDAGRSGPSDVVAVANETVELLARSIGPQVDLRLLAGTGVGRCAVDVSRAQLEQVVMNLVLNARDALGDQGGTITVSVGLEVAPRRPTARPAVGAGAVPESLSSAAGPLPAGTYVQLAVTDDGAGMTPEVARRACEPLFSTKPGNDHAGLGLAMVSGIVRRAGGDVQLRSTPGAGTTATVIIPAALGSVMVPVPTS
jgi:signal transduction histidine kinase